MKQIIVLFFIITVSHALDSSNMFFTAEPFNAYSEPEEEKKEEKTDANSEHNSSKLSMKEKLQGGGLYLNATLGFVTYTGYNRLGNSMTLALTKYFPKVINDYPGLFAEVDYSHPFRAVTDGLEVLPDISFYTGAAYGGYMFEMNEKTKVKAKLGVAYISDPVGGIGVAYGASIIRKIAIKTVELVGDVTVKGSIWYVTGGVRYKIPSKR